MAVNRYS
jgi:hypothetical protein